MPRSPIPSLWLSPLARHSANNSATRETYRNSARTIVRAPAPRTAAILLLPRCDLPARYLSAADILLPRRKSALNAVQHLLDNFSPLSLLYSRTHLNNNPH